MLQPMITCGLETFGLHKLNYCESIVIMYTIENGLITEGYINTYKFNILAL